MTTRANGRLGVAPCGHEGEAIIGQFYNCLVGCDRPDAGISSAKIMTKIPGHLDGCACLMCTIVRNTCTIQLGAGHPSYEYARVSWNRLGDQEWRVEAKTLTVQTIQAVVLRGAGDHVVWSVIVSGISLRQGNLPDSTGFPALYLKFGTTMRTNPMLSTVEITHRGCA